MPAHVWYVNDHGRYLLELAALDSAGISYEIDDAALALGILRLHLILPVNFEDLKNVSELPLVVTFPEYYPSFRPEVFAPTLQLARHQNPFLKVLCLIPRNTLHWKPEDTLVAYLKSQLSLAVSKGQVTDREILKHDEQEQAEPLSEYYTTESTFPVISDTSFFDSIQTTGPQILGTFRYGIPDREMPPTRIAILKCLDNNRQILGELPSAFQKLFIDRGQGVAFKTDNQPPADANDFDSWIQQQLGNKVQYKDLYRKLGTVGSITLDEVALVSFPEEVAAGQNGWGWLGYLKLKQIRNKRSETVRVYVRVLRSNEENFNQRVPNLKPLSNKTVTVVGLGALGAPSAIDFARNGVKELRLVDFDIVDPATAVRWPLGVAYSGLQKSTSLKRFIEENYPFTRVVEIFWKIGMPRLFHDDLPKKVSYEGEATEAILEGASLLYDASAEIGVMNFLSELARERQIPYISIEATEGVFGGQIMRSIPSKTKGCWMCLQHTQSEGKIEQPPKDSTGKIQTTGCGDISFTGTSFDLQSIYSAGVRLAVSTLCRNENGYPDVSWDVGILSLVDGDSNPIAPQWRTYSLEINGNCPYCASK